jgi:N-acetylneuraminic acid mutarotase
MKKLLFTLLLSVIILGANAQNYTWSNMPSLPHTLYSPASFSIGDKVYVISGAAVSYGISGYPLIMSHEVWEFNTVSSTWTQKRDYPGTAVYGASGFSIGSYGYVVNGWDSTGSGQGPATTWQYDPSTDSWTAKAAFIGSTRYTSAAFSVNGKGYVACGFSPYMNDVFCYDPTTDSWSQRSSFPGGPRQNMVAFTIGNTAYAGMGATGDNRASYFIESDLYKYDDLTDTWTQLSPFPGDAVAAAASFTINGNAYVVDGVDQNSVYYSVSIAPSNKVWKYTPASDTWSLYGVFPDSALFNGASASANGAGYMGFGGLSYGTFPTSRKFYRFGPATGAYSCNISVAQYQISNAVYNFQANGSFSSTAQINWDFGDGHTGVGTFVIHNYTSVGNYHVTAYVDDTSLGCSSNDTASVSVSNINNCSVAFNATNFGQTFTLSTSVALGAGPYNYQWSSTTDSTFSSTSPDPVFTVPVNIPENYCVTVTDVSGCVASACKTIVDSMTYYTPCQIYLAVYPDSAVPGAYYGILYTASNTPLTYTWDFGDGTTSNQPFPSHTYGTPGRYTICLTVSDGSGCSFSFCDSSFYAYKYGGGPMSQFNVRARQVLGVNDIQTSAKVALYPNPTGAKLTIDAAGQKVDNAIIYNLDGQQVLSVSSPVQNLVDVSGLSDGIYFMEIKVKAASTCIKFVKASN